MEENMHHETEILNETDVVLLQKLCYDIANCGNMLLGYKTTNTYGTPQMFMHSVSLVSSLFVWLMKWSKRSGGMPLHFPDFTPLEFSV
jgi:hypothetical protein